MLNPQHKVGDRRGVAYSEVCLNLKILRQDIRTVIKKLQDMSRNRRLSISEVEKILRLLLLSQARNAESAESDDINT